MSVAILAISVSSWFMIMVLYLELKSLKKQIGQVHTILLLSDQHIHSRIWYADHMTKDYAKDYSNVEQ